MINTFFKKNKKGQFYLFIAILLCISAYGLLSPSFNSKESNSNLNLLGSNYLYEAKNVVNHAIYVKSDPFTDLDEFTSSFISYAKTKNINLEIAYILKKDKTTKVVNYLKDELNITTHNKTIKRYETFTLTSTSLINLTYQGIGYTYSFTNDSVELKALIITN